MKKALVLCVFALLASSCASGSRSIREKKADIMNQAGAESLLRGDYAQALVSLHEAVKYDSESTQAWTNLGLAYAGKQEYKRAEECWKRALKIDSAFTDARANLGALYLQQKRLKESEKQLQKVLEDLTYPKAAQAHYNLALVYREQRRTLQEEQQLKLSLKADPGTCAAWFRLGRLQKERGDFTLAAESFTKSVAGVCFKNPEAHYEIGTLHLKSKNVIGAREKLLEIIQLFPESPWAQKAEATLSMIR